jgi:hypothetical protein
MKVTKNYSNILDVICIIWTEKLTVFSLVIICYTQLIFFGRELERLRVLRTSASVRQKISIQLYSSGIVEYDCFCPKQRRSAGCGFTVSVCTVSLRIKPVITVHGEKSCTWQGITHCYESAENIPLFCLRSFRLYDNIQRVPMFYLVAVKFLL